MINKQSLQRLKDEAIAWLFIIAIGLVIIVIFNHHTTSNFIKKTYYGAKFSLGFKLPAEFNSEKDKTVFKENSTNFFWKNYQKENSAGAQGNVLAENNLGLFFEKYNSTNGHLETAEAWYSKAAATGYGPAQYNLGRLYNYEK